MEAKMEAKMEAVSAGSAMAMLHGSSATHGSKHCTPTAAVAVAVTVESELARAHDANLPPGADALLGARALALAAGAAVWTARWLGLSEDNQDDDAATAPLADDEPSPTAAKVTRAGGGHTGSSLDKPLVQASRNDVSHKDLVS